MVSHMWEKIKSLISKKEEEVVDEVEEKDEVEKVLENYESAFEYLDEKTQDFFGVPLRVLAQKFCMWYIDKHGGFPAYDSWLYNVKHSTEIISEVDEYLEKLEKEKSELDEIKELDEAIESAAKIRENIKKLRGDKEKEGFTVDDLVVAFELYDKYIRGEKKEVEYKKESGHGSVRDLL